MSGERKKTKSVAAAICAILALMLFVVIGAVAVVYCSVFGVFDPKDLGVSYTEKDSETAMEKFNVVFDDDTDLSLLKKGDCSVEVGSAAMRTVSFTSAELTALADSFLGDAAEKQQILIKDDCRMVYSGKVNIVSFLSLMKPDAGELDLGPIEKINISMESEFVLKDGQLALRVNEISAGMFEETATEALKKLMNGNDVLPLGITTEAVGTVENVLTITAELPEEIVVTKKTP